jgi:hypothetical protein
MWQVIGGIALAVALMFGAYRAGTNAASGASYDNGYKAGKADGEKDGHARGVSDTNELRDKDLLNLIAEYRAQAETVRREAAEKVQEIERARNAELATLRRDYFQNLAQFRSINSDLLRRLRDARDTARAASNSNGSSAMPGASGDSTGIVGTAYTDWLFSEGGGERIVQLAELADQVNAVKSLCSDAWPKKAPEQRNGVP